jgi:hypothetical protein
VVVNTASAPWLGDLPAENKKAARSGGLSDFDLEFSDRAQSSRRQRAKVAKVPKRGGQVDHAAHIVDAEGFVTS